MPYAFLANKQGNTILVAKTEWYLASREFYKDKKLCCVNSLYDRV